MKELIKEIMKRDGLKSYTDFSNKYDIPYYSIINVTTRGHNPSSLLIRCLLTIKHHPDIHKKITEIIKKNDLLVDKTK